MSINLSSGKEIPIETHKARMVQKIRLLPVLRFFLEKLEAIDNWGRNLAEVFKKEMGVY